MAKMNFIDTTGNGVLAGLFGYFDALVLEGEKAVGHGIYGKGCDIPIKFVDKTAMDGQRDVWSRQCKKDFANAREKVLQLMKETKDRESWNRLKSLSDCPGIRDCEECVGSVNPLGLYFPLEEAQDGHPEIWICYDKIAASPDAPNQTARVIVHELAHAMMDIKPYNSWNRLFHIWMEEPMANKIALEYMKAAEANNPAKFAGAYKVSREFMERQSSNYGYGVSLYDHEQNGARFGWREWGNAKAFQDQKLHEQMDWLEEARKGTASTAQLQKLFDNIVDPSRASAHADVFGGRQPKDNQIFYKTTDGRIIKVWRSESRGNEIISHAYGTYGEMTFERPLDHLEDIFRRASITDVKLPNSLRRIGRHAFTCCRSLQQIAIPDSVTEIGLKAFRGCTSLKEVMIPDSVTVIGSRAFYGCSSLERITIPDSVMKIESDAFEGCPVKPPLKDPTIPAQCGPPPERPG